LASDVNKRKKDKQIAANITLRQRTKRAEMMEEGWRQDSPS
jgi:hypothetical protein